jgi:hypothetical protein
MIYGPWDLEILKANQKPTPPDLQNDLIRPQIDPGWPPGGGGHAMETGGLS